MKKWYKKWYWAFLAVGVVVATVLQVMRPQPDWTVETVPGVDLALSMDGSSRTVTPTSLRIRCHQGKAELRLYVPIKIMPPAGMPTGKITLNLTEEFRDSDRKPLPGANPDDRSGQSWAVHEADGYAVRPDAAAFIDQMSGQAWLFFRALGFGSDGLASSTIEFPLKGLAPYKARIAAACRA